MMKPRYVAAVLIIATVVFSAVIFASDRDSMSTDGVSRDSLVLNDPSVTLSSSAKEIPTFTQEKPSFTQVISVTPSVTSKPSATSTMEPTLTPVLEPFFSATAYAGYTFYGSQLEFMKNEFGWFYEVRGCAQSYSGVANVYKNDASSCVRVVQSKGERTTKGYLLVANNWYFAPGSGIGVPQYYMLYYFRDIYGIFDAINYWQDIGYDATIGIFVDEPYKLYSVVCDQYGIEVYFGGLKLPHKVIPLTEDELEKVESMPDLFPIWEKSLDS